MMFFKPERTEKESSYYFSGIKFRLDIFNLGRNKKGKRLVKTYFMIALWTGYSNKKIYV
jgi:hypothetical protein